MEYRVRVNWIGAAAVLAAGVVVSIVTSTAVVTRTLETRAKQSAKRAQEITVKGSARQRVRSDLGVWRITVRSESKTLPEAFTSLESGVARVQGFLAGKGFPAPELAMSAIETNTFYGRDDKGAQTREVTGYGLERVFTVTTADVSRADAAAGEVTQLLKEGVVVVSKRPEYYYSKVADLKVQILGEATKDAKARADEIARSSGCHIGEVRQAQMGVVQITQPNSTEVSGYGIYDTSTIDKDVSVVVTLTLGID